MSFHQTESDFLAAMDASSTLEDGFIGTIENMGSSLIAENGGAIITVIVVIIIIIVIVSERDCCPY